MRSSLALFAALAATAVLPVRAQAPWGVDPAPLLDVSSSAKSGAVLFTRVTGATRLSNGTIVIADLDDNTLHFFDATGKPLKDVGRAGGGPGEFRRLTWLGRCSGDSLHVWDMLQRRMAVFAPNGTFVRQYFVPSDTAAKANPFMTLACSPRGIIAFQAQPRMPKARPVVKDPMHPTRQDRVIRTTAMVSVATTTGTITHEIGERSSGPIYAMGGGGFPLPLAPTTYVAVAGDRVFVGTSDSTSTVEAYAADGTPTTLKLDIPARRSTEGQRSRAATAMASLAPPQMRTLAEDSLKVSPMPATLPPYSGLFGDSDGVLWVQLTVPGDASTRLRAVDSAGRTLGEISLPADVTVQEIGHDYVIGSYDDKDDIPHFALFPLHRGR
ncbi:MAG: hypothetical protein ACREL5_11075 [Gemmatimonadales bacterium]